MNFLHYKDELIVFFSSSHKFDSFYSIKVLLLNPCKINLVQLFGFLCTCLNSLANCSFLFLFAFKGSSDIQTGF